MDTLVDMLKTDLDKLQNNISKNYAKIVADELEKECRTAIELFYDQYDPEDPSLHNGRVYYYRHWNFRKSFKKYYKNHAPRYIGGVELMQSDLPNVYSGKNSSPQSVFDRVYLGLHGIASLQNIGVPRLKPSPIRMLLEKQDEILNSEDYVNRALDLSLHDSYSLF